MHFLIQRRTPKGWQTGATCDRYSTAEAVMTRMLRDCDDDRLRIVPVADRPANIRPRHSTLRTFRPTWRSQDWRKQYEAELSAW